MTGWRKEIQGEEGRRQLITIDKKCDDVLQVMPFFLYLFFRSMIIYFTFRYWWY